MNSQNPRKTYVSLLHVCFENFASVTKLEYRKLWTNFEIPTRGFITTKFVKLDLSRSDYFRESGNNLIQRVQF